MLRLIVLLSLVALSLACSCKPSEKKSTTPTTTTATTTTTTTPTTTAITRTDARKKREVQQADVLVETKLKFNPALNSIYMKALKEGIEQHADERQVMYDRDMVYEEMHQIGDKFAVKYSAFDFDCEKLHNFIATGKMKTDLIGNVTVKCEGEKVL